MIDDPDRVGESIAAGRLAICRRPDASSDERDGNENGARRIIGPTLGTLYR